MSFFLGAYKFSSSQDSTKAVSRLRLAFGKRRTLDPRSQAPAWERGEERVFRLMANCESLTAPGGRNLFGSGYAGLGWSALSNPQRITRTDYMRRNFSISPGNRGFVKMELPGIIEVSFTILANLPGLIEKLPEPN